MLIVCGLQEPKFLEKSMSSLTLVIVGPLTKLKHDEHVHKSRREQLGKIVFFKSFGNPNMEYKMHITYAEHRRVIDGEKVIRRYVFISFHVHQF